MTTWLAWVSGGLGAVAMLIWHRAMREVSAAPAEVQRRAGLCPHVVQKPPSRTITGIGILVFVFAADGAATGDSLAWFVLGLLVSMLLYLAALILAMRQALRQVMVQPQPQEVPLPDPCQAYRFPVARYRVYEHAAFTMLFLLIALVTRHPFTMGMPLAWVLVTWGVRRQMKRQAAAMSSERSAVSRQPTADRGLPTANRQPTNDDRRTTNDESGGA